MLTTDNPNGAPFVKYPEIIALLMSKKYRDAEFATVHPDTGSKVVLPALDRELDWNEIAVMTRAGQAKALGITGIGKGHLGIGAEADIAVYPLKIDEIDPSTEYRKVIDGFAKTKWTVKRGRPVARDGEVLVHGENTTIWVDPKIRPEHDMSVDPRFVEMFNRWYSVRMSNYPVQDEYLKRNLRMETEAAI